MKAARALAFSSLVLVTCLDAFAASPDAGGARSAAAAARKTLEAARVTLAKAVQLIEKDPPATADLDAAHAAAEALKDAIDAGAKHESEDLELAKSVLAARKELRTQREFVDDRRAKVHIHNHRRAIDQALASLTDRVRGLEAKEPGAKDFEGARAAAAALEKALEEARQFAKQDEKFAKRLEEVDTTLARHQKAIDDRWTLLSADKHRALVKESRDALSAAVTALATGGNDAQFEAADRAAAALSKRLEEGKPLEAKDKTYRADADRARAELAQAKTRMEKLLSETGLARLKAEIEPAHKDLVAAGKAVRGRGATADQLAEAKTAAIVVRGLIEKFQSQAALSQPFRQYVNEVKKTLVEVEVELQRRSLDSARKELASALRNLERRAVTDEQFEEAKTAQVVLEKTLETVHAKDPALAALVGDVRTLLRTAKTTVTKRRLEVEVQRQRAKVEEAKKAAAALMTQLQQPTPGDERLSEAANAVKQIGAVLEEGAALIKKDREYATYDREVKKRIAELEDRIAKRALALSAGAGRLALTETIAGAKAKLEAAKQPAAAEPDLDAAAKSIEAVGKELEAHTALEKQDKGYAAHAERARMDLEGLNEALELAKQARALRRQTVEPLSAGVAAADSATATQDLRAQKARYEKAVAHFRSCESTGKGMVKENRALEKIVVLVDGSPSSPKEVTALCDEKAKATEQLLKQVVALIGFEDGPKKAYEAGKVLLAKAKKTEALTQFYDCISSGKILLHRNPDLKDRQFQVAGGSMTLAEVIQQCLTHRDALGSK